MNIPVKNGTVTTGFHEPRPLSNPGSHKHGALDVSGGDGMVCSPCEGVATPYMFIRSKDGSWAAKEKIEIDSIPVKDYWYDVYGGLIVIIENKTGVMHVMAHFWAKVLQERFGEFKLIESSAATRWPSFALVGESFKVSAGQALASMGNAGFSTGAHVHWEVHHAAVVESHADRINPERYIK
jgi:hypothetical protein